MTYVFLGGVSEVLDLVGDSSTKLTRFGQRVELSEEQARDAEREGGLPAIPAERFDALQISAEDLAKYGAAGAPAPPAFQEKRAQALAILHDIRAAHAAAAIEEVK